MFFLVLIGGLLLAFIWGLLHSDSGPQPKLAVDCPTCGIKPIETAREAKVIRGRLLVTMTGHIKVVGCTSCVTSQVRQITFSNLFLGWWSPFGLFLTYFYLLHNVYNWPTRPNTAYLKSTLSEVGLSYEDVKLNKDGTTSGQMKLLKNAAAVLGTIANVEGINSSEWERAKLALIGLSDQFLNERKAQEFLEQEKNSRITPAGLTEEQRLILIRVAIDVALADGSITPKEVTAIEEIATQLNLDPNLVRSLIDMILGGGEKAVSENEYSKACKVLGVSLEASISDIRSAYKRLMMQHHPDLVEPDKREEATQKAMEINASYDLLIGRSKTSFSSSQTRMKTKGNTNQESEQQSTRTKTGPKKKLCSACERRISDEAKFCGFCGTRL